MDNINDLLKDYSGRHGLEKTLPAAKVVEVANKISNGKYRAVSFCDGRLKIEVQAGPGLFFIRKDSSDIIKKINKIIGKDKIEKLVIRGV